MLFLAIRHLVFRKRQTFLIFLGISLGALIYVLISGIQLGFREFIIDRLISNDAHIKISAHEENITQQDITEQLYPKKDILWFTPPYGKRDEAHILYPQGWFEKLEQDPEVLSYSPQIVIQAILNRAGINRTINLVGIIPEKQAQVTNVSQYITEGKLENLSSGGSRIILGDEALKNIGAKINDSVLVSTGSGQAVPFKIAGAFHLGVQQLDESLGYGYLRDVQQLNQTPGRITNISVSLVDVTKAQTLAHEWAQRGRDKVQSWDEANASFLQIFKFQDIIRLVITGSIVIVAAFSIYNVLTIIISQKKREIAILRSMGFSPKEILELFLFQGVVLGLGGSLVGLFLGFLICHYLESLDFNIMGRKGFIISYSPTIYLTAFAMAMISSILASLLPARGASKLTPMAILRSET